MPSTGVLDLGFCTEDNGKPAFRMAVALPDSVGLGSVDVLTILLGKGISMPHLSSVRSLTDLSQVRPKY